jgi:hypothetical protein
LGKKQQNEQIDSEQYDDILTTSEAGRLLELCSESVRQLVRLKRLPAMRTPRGQNIFKAKDVLAMKKQRDEEKREKKAKKAAMG